ncbi:MAG TPA: hypothetical protein VID27_17770 [Blastocatellia bacterium]|jgi:hypothetical protein
MIAVLIIAFLLIAAAAFAAVRRQRALPENESAYSFDPPPFRGLFDSTDQHSDGAEEDARLQKRADLLERAAAGDLETLAEAHNAGDPTLYAEALDALTSWAEQRQENLAALVSRISKDEGLRSSARLAELMIEACKKSPDRRSTIEMIHIAALADDLHWFEKAIDSALALWRAGAMRLSAKELGDLIESEYWMLAPEATSSAAGYMLRLKLADVRRELAAATFDR